MSFSVGASEMLAIVGESGSGKSVTGLSIMRLFGRTGAHIDAGELWFRSSDGAVDLARLDEDQMARIRGQEIAIIFQDPMSSLNPVLTIGDQIGEGLRVHKGLSRAQAREAAIALLTRVGIPDAAERVNAYPHQFSGGMRQRVMIAIALAANPRLLIADEPTTALDVTIQAQIVALLKALQRDERMAMIFITHDLALVGDIADRVAVMYAGEIVETGPAQEVVEAPRHPYTRHWSPAWRGMRQRKAGGAGRSPFPVRCPTRIAALSDAASRRDARSPMPTAERAQYRWRRYRPSVRSAVSSGGRLRHDGRFRSALVEGKGLSKWFESQKGAPVRAVETVSFAIAEREVLGIVGESGSGKSTLGRLALRLLEPSAGAMQLRRPGSRRPGCEDAAPVPAQHADGVPGSVRQSQRAHDHRRRARRGHCPAPWRRASARHASEPRRCWRRSGFRRPFSTAIRARVQAVSASVLRLPARSRPIRGSSWRTNRCPRSMCRSRPRC